MSAILNASFAAGLIVALTSIAAPASERPPPAGPGGQPVTASALERMRLLGHHRLAPWLEEKARYKLLRAELISRGLSESDQALILFQGPQKAFPFKIKPFLEAKGLQNVLTILVDFKDMRAKDKLPGISSDDVHANIFGDGTADAQKRFPYESVRNYYRRASDGMLDLTGNVYGWISLPNDRKNYGPKYPPGADKRTESELNNDSVFKIAVEALKKIDHAVDFRKFDNNKDQIIDLVVILYAGPRGEWNDFWWAYQWYFFDTKGKRPKAVKFDGKYLEGFLFLDVSQTQTGDFDVSTFIHETGHALGLPDLYDYCSKSNLKNGDCKGIKEAGPDGGVGGQDMMDHNLGNHNAFSRWLLEWAVPEVVKPGAETIVRLRASGDPATSGTKSVAIFPGLKPTLEPGQELFIAEYRKRVGNDAGEDLKGNYSIAGEGLLIWHIDSRPNERDNDFLRDNSYTTPKLIRMMRRGKTDDFFGDNYSSDSFASEDDFFRPGDIVSADTVPSTNSNDGAATGVVIRAISEQPDGLDVGFTLKNIPAAPSAPSKSAPAAGPVSTKFEEAVAAAFDSPSRPEIDIDALERAASDLQDSTPEALAAKWKELLPKLDFSSPLPTQEMILAETVLMNWAAKDGRSAASAILDLTDNVTKERAFTDVMQAWVLNDAAGADAWYLSSEGEKFRADTGLVGGGEFSRMLFEWRAKSMDNAAVGIDYLSNTADIFGAVTGIQEAYDYLGYPKDRIGIDLNALKLHSDDAKNLLQLKNTLDASPSVLTQDPGSALLKEKLKLLGIEGGIGLDR